MTARRLMPSLVLSALLAACGSAPTPAPPLLHLGLATPPTPTPTPTPATAAASVAGAWQLASPLRVPAALDREAVMVSPRPGELEPWRGLRWSEPLRDTVPRLLLQDLATLRGNERIWAGTPPPGLRVERVLRVEVLGWDALEHERQLRLQARWALSDPTGAAAPLLRQAELSVPWSPATPATLVTAQRALLWQLAQAIAASAP